MFTRAFKFCLAPVSSKRTLLDRHPLNGRNHTLPAHGSRYTAATTAWLPLHGRDNRTAPAHGCQGTATAARLTGCASQNATATARLPPRDRNRTLPAHGSRQNCHAH